MRTTLRSSLIHLAHKEPQVRPFLLPLLKDANLSPGPGVLTKETVMLKPMGVGSNGDLDDIVESYPNKVRKVVFSPGTQYRWYGKRVKGMILVSVKLPRVNDYEWYFVNEKDLLA